MSKQYDFDEAIALEVLPRNPEDPYRYSAKLGQRWAWFGVTAGGYMASMMLKAVMQRYTDRNPAALHMFFLQMARPGPCIIEVEDIKPSAKGVCLVRAILKQASKKEGYDTKCYAIVTIAAVVPPEKITKFHPDARKPPCTKDMEHVPILPKKNDPDPTLRVYRNLKNERHGVPETHHIFEFSDLRPMDTLALPYLVDTAKHPLDMYQDDQLDTYLKPTLHYEVQFKNPVPTNTTRVLSSFVSMNVIDGRFDVDVWIYSEDGQLLATGRHHGTLFPITGTAKSRI
ncbi:thioesterase-like superfamily-domain-containing protein [Fennellomyces sp. T-0311]|nr:thioesterase-like superfamily-domain-containing protein [Fennellomyces sp. T-0311]